MSATDLFPLPPTIEGIVVDPPVNPFARLSMDEFLAVCPPCSPDQLPRRLRRLARLALEETRRQPGDTDAQAFSRFARFMAQNRPDRHQGRCA